MPDKMEEDAMEPDYEKFEELMAFRKSLPHEMHVSFHEALEAASALPEGKRSLSELRRLITKAQDNERGDFCFLESKLGLGGRKWGAVIDKNDVEENLPLTFGCMLGMNGPDNSTKPDDSTESGDGLVLLPGSYFHNVWENHFIPLAYSRENGLICKLVSEILLMAHTGVYSWGYESVRKSMEDNFEMFKAYLKEKHRPWHQQWTTKFPELMKRHHPEEMHVGLDKEFCDWVDEQDNWLWGEEI
ncbi:hypothetical protein J3E68DRAFT_397966 [Trichoderma sp. SZMC 28012]